MKRARGADGSIETGNRLLKAMKPASGDATGNLALQAEEAVKFEATNVKLLTCRETTGTGKLVVTNKRMVWLQQQAASASGASTTGAGYELSHHSIVMHAVCKDKEAFAEPCLYCHVDIQEAERDKEGERGGLAALGSGGDDEDEMDEDGATEELCLVPADEAQLAPMFEAFAAGAAEVPMDGEGPDGQCDEDGMGEDADGDEAPYTVIGGPGATAGGFFGAGSGWFTADTDESQLSEAGRAALAQLNGMLDTGSTAGASGQGCSAAPGQFEDAEEKK